jgi:hypothetical protein
LKQKKEQISSRFICSFFDHCSFRAERQPAASSAVPALPPALVAPPPGPPFIDVLDAEARADQRVEQRAHGSVLLDHALSQPMGHALTFQ